MVKASPTTTFRSRVLLGLCLTALPAVAQDLARVKRDASAVWIKPDSASIAALHVSLRDWIEAAMPKSLAGLSSLRPNLYTELERAGLLASSSNGGASNPGFVERIEITQPPEDPNKLVVIVGVGVRCGSNDAVYIYDYSPANTGNPAARRVLEALSTRAHDEIAELVQFAPPLVLTLRKSVQCGGSLWSVLSYDLFRLADVPEHLLGGEQGMDRADDDPYRLRLTRDDLLLEVIDRTIGDGIRTHVLHFSPASPLWKRVDPVALQPQDFVDEWLTRPWSEMASRSADLEPWHNRLAGEATDGTLTLVQQCQEKPGDWQIGVKLAKVSAYFLVHQTAPSSFKMTGVSLQRQPGCPGSGQPSNAHPSLFPAK